MMTWYTVYLQTPVSEDGSWKYNKETVQFHTRNDDKVTSFLSKQGEMAYTYFVREWDRDPDDYWAEIVDDFSGEDWLRWAAIP